MNKIHNLSINVTLPVNNNKQIMSPLQLIELAPLQRSNLLPPINKSSDNQNTDSSIAANNSLELKDENNSVISSEKLNRMHTETDKSIASQASTTLLINVAEKKSDSYPSLNAPEENLKISTTPRTNKKQSSLPSGASSPNGIFSTTLFFYFLKTPLKIKNRSRLLVQLKVWVVPQIVNLMN